MGILPKSGLEKAFDAQYCKSSRAPINFALKSPEGGTHRYHKTIDDCATRQGISPCTVELLDRSLGMKPG